jgi:hypothetical protein
LQVKIDVNIHKYTYRISFDQEKYNMASAKTISDEVAADDNGITASAQVANNAALVIGGALADGGAVTFAGGRVVEITSGGNDAAIDFTIAGTDVDGASLSITIDGGNTGAVETSAFFATIASITAVGDPAGTVIAGTSTEAAGSVFSGGGRLRGMAITSGGTAGIINLHNGLTAGVPGTILFKARTVGTDNTNEHYAFPDDGILFDSGCYVTYTIGHIYMMTFYFN